MLLRNLVPVTIGNAIGGTLIWPELKNGLPRAVITRAMTTIGPFCNAIDAGISRAEASMRVRELMSRGITTIRSDASCQEAVERMYRNKVRHLPVVDDGRPVGMVTDRDLRHHVLARGLFDQDRHRVDDLLRAIPVRVIMSSPVFSVAPDDPIEVAVRRMLQDKVGSLPVLEDGRPVGILTETDLLRQICRMHPCSPDVEYVVLSSA